MHPMIQTPWPHMIVDNFYDVDLFNDMETELVKFIDSEIVKKPHYNIRSDECNMKVLFPATFKCIKSADYKKYYDWFENKRQSKNYLIYHGISIITDGHEFPIHDEHPGKILTFVNYVNPNNGIGTMIYDKDKNYVGDIPWVKNRSLVFAGIDNITWHAYRSPPWQVRITLNTFFAIPGMTGRDPTRSLTT